MIAEFDRDHGPASTFDVGTAPVLLATRDLAARCRNPVVLAGPARLPNRSRTQAPRPHQSLIGSGIVAGQARSRQHATQCGGLEAKQCSEPFGAALRLTSFR